MATKPASSITVPTHSADVSGKRNVLLRARSVLDRRFGNRAGPTVDDYLQPYSVTAFRNGYLLRLAAIRCATGIECLFGSIV